MDATLYVRLEGVNLDNFVFDVHDLSTIRGGSFLLLDAVRRVRERFKLTAISTGASSGFFTVPPGNGTRDATALRGEIERFLNDADGPPRPEDETEQLKHATFVVDVYSGEDSDDGFATAHESLMAMNRWRQFQQPTVAVPAHADVQDECAFDHVRPATRTIKKKEGEEYVKKPASASVFARRTFGIEKKKSFYEAELRQLAESIGDGPSAADEHYAVTALAGTEMKFTNDLEVIADDKDQGSLNGKIAVVYFDGNKFGSIQKNCDRTDLETFDRTVKSYRGTALFRLLRAINTDSRGWLTSGEIRLETLLWGGDELIWVVPAWKGWSVLQLFYQTSRDWQFTMEDKSVKPLTHAGGIVFCHHVAPIHRITALAKKLADSCKESFDKMPKPADDHASRDVFAYQVLESFDHIGTDFDTFRKTRVPPDRRDLSVRELIVHGAGMDKATAAFDVVRRTFPRSKLHQIVALIRDQEGENASSMMEKIEKTVGDLRPEGKRAVIELLSFFDPPSMEDAKKTDSWKMARTGWYHIAELWDYAICGTARSEEAEP